MMNQLVSQKQLDNEWVDLIFLAKAMGITSEEVRQFLQNNSDEK